MKSNTGDSNPNRYYIHVYFGAGSKMENVRAFLLLRKLGESGTVNGCVPDDLQDNADAANYIIENGFYVDFTTFMTREEIENTSKNILSVESLSFIKKMPANASASS